MKGTIWDLFVISLIMFTLAIGIAVAYVVLGSVTSTMDSSATSVGILANANSALGMFNYGFVIIFGGLSLVTLIFAYMTPQHPIFFIVTLVLTIILMVIVPQYSNAFELFMGSSIMSPYSASMNIVIYIMGNLPYFVAGLALAIMFVSYVRFNNQGSFS